MNIEAQTLSKSTQTSASETKQKTSTGGSQNVSKQADAKSFKSELDSIKGTEKKPEENSSDTINSQIDKQAANSQVDKAAVTTTQPTDKKTLSTHKNILNSSDADNKNILGLPNTGESNLLSPLNELESKIASIKDLKSGTKSGALKSQKTDKDSLEATIDYKTIKMDSNDALFFANLVNSAKLENKKSGTDSLNSSDMKTEATQSASKVSATLADALSESMKTNKPFRIDFDKDIAVILRVDKEGKLSAEFIPGDKAVEQYLKNNIPMLKERFAEQNLSYGDLSYQRPKQQQQAEDNNRKENKENDDE